VPLFAQILNLLRQTAVFGLGLGLVYHVLGLGLVLEAQVLGLGLGLAGQVLVNITEGDLVQKIEWKQMRRTDGADCITFPVKKGIRHKSNLFKAVQ